VSGTDVEISSRTFAIPFECPCCGADPDTELAVPVTRGAGREVVRETARALAFPYCKRCLAHVERWDAVGIRSAAMMIAGVVAAVVLSLATRVVIGAIAFAAAALLAWSLTSARRAAVRAALGPSCASPDRALAFLGWSGRSSAFSFASPTYAARFAEQNTKLLVQVGEQLRKLLEGHRIARLAVPTPAAAHLVVPPPASTAEWIARIENSRSTVERRNTLRRALDASHDPGERAQLLEAACRIELAPVLGRLDGLSGAGAKKHRLQRAIDEVRADNMPEELQEFEVRQLEARLSRER
jgi:hypothetical protein